MFPVPHSPHNALQIWSSHAVPGQSVWVILTRCHLVLEVGVTKAKKPIKMMSHRTWEREHK